MNKGKKTKAVLKSAMKKKHKYNADMRMEISNGHELRQDSNNRNDGLHMKISDNSTGLHNDSISDRHTIVKRNFNSKKKIKNPTKFNPNTPLLKRSPKGLPGFPESRSQTLLAEYKTNEFNGTSNGFNGNPHSLTRSILTPKKKDRLYKPGKYFCQTQFRRDIVDQYQVFGTQTHETRSYADSETLSNKTSQTKPKRMSKSTIQPPRMRGSIEMENKPRMFKEAYNIHTEFPFLNERKQNTPKLDTKKFQNRARKTQRTINAKIITDGSYLPISKRRPFHFDIKTEGHLPAIDSFEGRTDYDPYKIPDVFNYSKPDKSVKSYRPHPLAASGSRRKLKFSSVKISNKINIREKMDACQEIVAPKNKFVRIMDTNKEYSIPKFEHQDLDETPDADIYSDSDALEEEKVGSSAKVMSQTRKSEDKMVKTLKTKVAKDLAMTGKITMMPGTKATSSMVKKKFEQSKDYKIAMEMVTDLRTVDQFRNIQKSEFLTRDPFEDNYIMTCDIETYKTQEEKKIIIEDINMKHQKAYIKYCKSFSALPLPLLKKIKYEKLVLKNYQLNPAVTKAFGLSMHHLKNTIKGVILSNNNMKDSEIVLILEGMKYNPITSLIIENNKIGPLSLESLCKIICYDEVKWYEDSPGKEKESLNRIKQLELTK